MAAECFLSTTLIDACLFGVHIFKLQLRKVPLKNGEDETCKTFVIKEEDHTLGNSLRYMIMKNPEVEFCGYSVPHPSEERINFRIQTKGAPATDVLKQGLNDLTSLCEHVKTTFENSVKQYKKSHESQQEQMDVAAD